MPSEGTAVFGNEDAVFGEVVYADTVSGGPIYITLATVTTAGTAQALSYSKEIYKTLTVTTTTSAAQELFTGKELTPATSTSSARTLTYSKTLKPVLSTSTAQQLTHNKAIFKTLTTVTTTSAAQALTYTKAIVRTLTPALSASVAQGLDYTATEPPILPPPISGFVRLYRNPSAAVALKLRTTALSVDLAADDDPIVVDLHTAELYRLFMHADQRVFKYEPWT